MKVLVTGASGMLGVNLIHELLYRDYSVVAFSRNTESLEAIQHELLEVRKGSILNRAAVQEVIKGCAIVVHAAAMVNTWPTRSPQYFKVNVEGTRILLEASLVENIHR